MTLIQERHIDKVGKDLLSLDGQVDECIAFFNSILLNFNSIRFVVATDGETFVPLDEVEVDEFVEKAKQKIKEYANSL